MLANQTHRGTADGDVEEDLVSVSHCELGKLGDEDEEEGIDVDDGREEPGGLTF